MSYGYALFRIFLYSTLVVALYYFYLVVYLDPCERAQTYSIDTIEPSHIIEQWRLEELLWSVEDMWEQSFDLELFRYVESNGDISVNIIQNNNIKNLEPGESFEKGSHFRGEINIYHFENEADLIKVLAHEFGHALDMGHVTGDESIMAATFMQRTRFPLSLTEFDRDEFINQCREI